MQALIEVLESRALPTVFHPAPGDLSNTLAHAHAGDVVSLHKGTYTNHVTIPAGVDVKGVKQGKTILAGRFSVLGGLEDLTIEERGVSSGGGMQNDQAAVTLLTHAWLYKVTEQDYEGTGVAVRGDHVRVRYSTIKNNGTNGIGGENARDVILDHVAVLSNNTGWLAPSWAGKPHTLQLKGLWFTDAGWEGGAGKWFETTELKITHCWFNDNRGPLWLDGYNRNYLVIDNLVENAQGTRFDWQGQGIAVEISYDGIVTGNVVKDTTGSSIAILESNGVKVTGNEADDIEMRSIGGRPVALGNVQITDNVVSGAIFCSVGQIPGSVEIANNSKQKA